MTHDLTKNIFIKRRGILEKEIEGCTVIYDEAEGEVLRLNDVASRIWSALDIRHTIEDIASAISRDFKKEEKAVRKDVVDFTKHLKCLGLVEQYSQESAFKKLNEVYYRFPEAICERCARCCSTTVIYSIEFENIKNYMENHFSADLRKELNAKLSLNMATWIQQREYMSNNNIGEMRPLEVCAFLKHPEKKCLIYSLRPFACRVFGLENKSDCYTQNISLKESKVPTLEAENIKGMRSELDSLSRYYKSPSSAEPFNKAEINFWFYYDKQLNIT
ncbi:MAG: PqqD family peptide modification chaperone [Candidatus Omnitrophota bacterium]